MSNVSQNTVAYFPHCSCISIELPIITLHFYSSQSPAEHFSGRTNNVVSWIPPELNCLDSTHRPGGQAVGSCVACVVTGQSRCPDCATLDEHSTFTSAVAHTAR